MKPTLRHIAIHVSEPRQDSFVWVLSELDDGQWHELDKAGSSAATYHQAMADGLLALQSMVDDLDSGPRRTGTTGNVGPSAPVEEPTSARAAGASSAKNLHFGFGPAR